MRIFLTGGTGFIGSHFINQAHLADHEIVALRRENSEPKIPLLHQPQWIKGNLANVPDRSLETCDVMVHLAAHGVMMPLNVSWDDCFFWNVTAPLKLWQQAHNAGIHRFIICGSCFEYGLSAEKFDFIPVDAPLFPAGPYHASKAAATMAALGFSISHAAQLMVLRPFHAYGEGEAAHRFWPSLRRAALAGEDLPMTTGEQIRDFMPVEEVASAFVAATTRDDLQPGKPLIENLGTGRPQSIADFARNEWRRFGATGKLLFGAVSQRPNEVMRYVPKIAKPR